MYFPVYLRARERIRTAAYRREPQRRQTTVEGVFASLNRLGWLKSRLRRMWKVHCEGYMATFAHRVLRMARKLGCGGVHLSCITCCWLCRRMRVLCGQRRQGRHQIPAIFLLVELSGGLSPTCPTVGPFFSPTFSTDPTLNIDTDYAVA